MNDKNVNVVLCFVYRWIDVKIRWIDVKIRAWIPRKLERRVMCVIHIMISGQRTVKLHKQFTRSFNT